MSSVSTEAAAKLRDKSWRRKTSWWMWVPILTAGTFGWVGFVVAGVRFGERRYWVAAALSGVGAAFAFLFVALDNERDTVLADIGSGFGMITMVGCVITAGIWNKEYLVKMAERNVYGSPEATSMPPPTSSEPLSESFLGVSNAEFFASGQAPTPATAPVTVPARAHQPPVAAPQPTESSLESVDINATSAEQLVAALSVSSEIATRVVRLRSAGRFEGFDDLVRRADLAPHEAVRFRAGVSYGRPSARPDRPSGRVLDL